MANEQHHLNGIKINVDCIESSAGSENEREFLRENSSRRKEFKLRNSPMTDLYAINNFRSLYNLFVACLLLLFVNVFFTELKDFKTLRLSFELISSILSGLEIMVLIWIVMFIYTTALYGWFRLWFSVRKSLLSSKWLLTLWDHTSIFGYLIYHVMFIAIPPIVLMKNMLSPMSRGILVAEQLRFMMKSHGFVGTVLRVERKIEKCASMDQKANYDFPSFSKYFYFLFAPTLVYRDTYPRTEKIRWKIVLWNFCEVIGIIYFGLLIYERIFFPHLRTFWDEKVTLLRLIVLACQLMFPGLLLLIFCFYGLFHSWLNTFAEVLKFGDRLFYKEWWNTSTFATYYRSWNLVVHDWIREYIYLDMNKKFSKSFNKEKQPQSNNVCRLFSKTFILFISAAFHEYIFMVSLGFFFPVMLILFGVIGVFLTCIPNFGATAGNMYIWLCLSIGSAILLTAYCVEYYARMHCNSYPDVVLDFFIPRTWACNSTLPSLF